MKKYIGVLLLSGFLSFPISLFSQLDVYMYIGKSQTYLIKHLGTPAHIDKSNPSMVMIFYNSSDSRKSFVANEDGIFQAESYQSFNSEKSARVALNDCISEMMHKGFAVDTVSVSEFSGEKQGVNCSLYFGLNHINNEYEIRTTAHRKE
jgi:hypothetical protein